MKIYYPKDPKIFDLTVAHTWKYGDVMIQDYANGRTVAWSMLVSLGGKRPWWCPNSIYERLKKSMLKVEAKDLRVFVKGQF